MPKILVVDDELKIGPGTLRVADSGSQSLGIIVEAHGGSLTAANRAQGGAVFTIRLPIRS